MGPTAGRTYLQLGGGRGGGGAGWGQYLTSWRGPGRAAPPRNCCRPPLHTHIVSAGGREEGGPYLTHATIYLIHLRIYFDRFVTFPIASSGYNDV